MRDIAAISAAISMSKDHGRKTTDWQKSRRAHQTQCQAIHDRIRLIVKLYQPAYPDVILDALKGHPEL